MLVNIFEVEDSWHVKTFLWFALSQFHCFQLASVQLEFIGDNLLSLLLTSVHNVENVHVKFRHFKFLLEFVSMVV